MFILMYTEETLTFRSVFTMRNYLIYHWNLCFVAIEMRAAHWKRK